MKPRGERIADVEFKIQGIKLVLEPLQRQLDDAEAELDRVKNGYDIGERVHIEKTCVRGCCIEEDYDGTVVAENKHTYQVKDDAGELHTCVSPYDMMRLT